MKNAAQINAEAFVKMLIEKNQPLEGFEFTEWTSNATGLRWFSVARGNPGNIQFPRLSQHYVAPDSESLAAFQSAIAVAVMQAI